MTNLQSEETHWDSFRDVDYRHSGGHLITHTHKTEVIETCVLSPGIRDIILSPDIRHMSMIGERIKIDQQIGSK